jgi:hypothetical protein
VRWAGALLLLAAAPLAAQEPRLDLALSPRQVTVGDPVEAVLTLRVPRAALAGEPRFPAWNTNWGEAEILEKGEAQKAGEAAGVATWKQRLVLAAYRPGAVALPPVQLAIPLKDRTLQVQTPPAVLDIRSVLPANEKDPKPKPPAPLRALPVGAAFWWTLGGLSAACALLGWALWRQRRRQQAQVAAALPALPPFAELVAALEGLAGEPSMLHLHTRLSLALRCYLGRVLGVPAAESTTSEVQRILRGRRLPSSVERRTIELLRACDLVKFARQEVEPRRGQERAAAARELGREVERFVRPPASEEATERLEMMEKAG